MMNRDVIRRGSAPSRTLLSASPLSSSLERDEVTHRGYMNRKTEGTMGRRTKVPHREKNWQLYWCNMKGTQLEFYKVDGIRVKPGDPPPKDIYPPKNILRTKIDQLDLDSALVEVDYVSQEKKDIQKRRKHLFHVLLKSGMEYLMQASTEMNRSQWVTLMQRVACNQIQPEDSFLGHAIKTSRDSIKHTSKQTVSRSVISPSIPTDLSVSASTNEDPDYIEFSTAESIISSGGDPRLQGLRKRLQAKKELLKQFDRMYSSFLGGSAAAMYDDTLILQQLEPPTFNCGSPVLSTSPSEMVRSRKPSQKVLHRKLTLSDSVVDQAKSVDRDMDEIDEGNEEESVPSEVNDRRASTGEMSLPAVITPMSPLPNKHVEVLETELLKDYYLVPGAEWSLLKKGEIVEIIGQAKETGWYRCMALREAKIELDRAPLSFMIRSMINMQSSGGGKSSGITPEMIEEEYSQTPSLSLSSDANAEFLGSDGSPVTPPPPLMPKSCPPYSPLGSMSTNPSEDFFPIPVEMETLTEGVEEEEEDGEGEEEKEARADMGNKEIVTDEKISESENRENDSNDGESLSKVPEVRELSSQGEEPTGSEAMTVTEEEKQQREEEEEVSDEVIKREKKVTSQVKRPRSYELATGEIQTLESYLMSTAHPKANEDNDSEEPLAKENLGRGAEEKKAKSSEIKRSTSFSPAAIKLRSHIKPEKGPRALSVGLNFDSPTTPDSSTRNSAYYSLKSFSSPRSRLDRLIEKEIMTGSYPSPLIGCIPPSALKCCMDKGEEKEGGAPRPISLTQSQSDVGGSDGTANADSASSSRPVSEITSDPNDSVQEKRVPVKFEGSESRESREGSSETENGPLQNRRLSTRSQELRSSASLDEDSDAEADRRLADMFNTNIVIEPEQDMDLLKTHSKHVRAKSLPPPMNMRLMPPTPPLPLPKEEEEEENATSQSSSMQRDGTTTPEESSLDIHMSQMVVRSPEHMAIYPPSQSVGSSPVHRATVPIPHQRRSTSPYKSDSKAKSGSDIGGLFESPPSSKSGLLKKWFTRKRGTKLNTPIVPSSGRTSPGPPPGMLKQVLLGNTGDFEEQEDMSIARARVSSMSGRPVHQLGMAIVIGDMSSSESEEEESNLMSSYASLDEASQNQEIPSNGRSTPSSPSYPENNSLVDVREGKSRLVSDSPRVDAIFDIAPKPALGKLKRSASEHDSISLKASLASATKENDPGNKLGSTSSLKRNTSTGKKARKQMSGSSLNDPSSGSSIKRNRLSKKKKKRPLSAYATDSNEVHMPGSTEQDPAIKISGIFRQPPRGEKRFVYLDPSAGKYGFRLQSYGRLREQGKVLQTFVQSVIPGSPSFMAGLYPGDTIVEVNGMDVRYAPVEDVVEAIQKGTVSEERVALKVEFVDGVTRLDCMKKSDEFNNEIKKRQSRLKELLNDKKENQLSIDLPSPLHIVLASETPKWAGVIPESDNGAQKYPYNRHLNNIVAIHSGNIRGLESSVLVMPISSCHKAKNITDKNSLLQLLQSGGPELLDDLSLAKQCKIGENIVTGGYALPTKYIYHCVFGDLEESLQSCCHKAMEEAHKEKLQTIVFWLDGFASLSVSPHIVIEAARHWLQQQNNKRDVFERVVFSSKANTVLVEKLMHQYFPLFPSATRDSGNHDSDIIENGCDDPLRNGSDTDTTQKRTDPIQNGIKSTEEGDTQDIKIVINGDKSSDPDNAGEDIDASTEELLKSLQAIQDDAMMTFEELVGQLADCKSVDHINTENLADSPLDMFSQSLPADAFFHVDESSSPSNEFNHTRSQSGDMVLNPLRTESEV